MLELPLPILDLLRKIHAQTPQHAPLLSQLRRELLSQFTRLEQQVSEPQLEQLAYQDAVTGLPNQWLGRRFLEHHLAEGGTAALVVMDVKGMRDLNRYLGRELGDAFLKVLALRIRQALQDEDVLVRGEDDELWLILSSSQAGKLGEQKMLTRARQTVVGLQQSLAEPLPVQDQAVQALLRCGAVCAAAGASVEQLLERARWAADSTKAGEELGFWQSREEQRLEERRQLLPMLQDALQRQQFVLCFQPVVKLENLQIQGVECLLRWEHPQLGRVGPDRFLTAACQSGQIVAIGNWVMQQACALSRELPEHYIAFNVSAQEMLQGDFTRRLSKALAAYQLRADRLMLEVSEIHLALDNERFFGVLQEIRRWNVHIAVDDFTFDSFSLRRLERIQARFLKLGPELARNIDHPTYRGLLKGAVLVAEGMGCRLIAEGIESDAQLKALREGGCHWGQGHWLGPLLERSDLARALGYEEEVPPDAGHTPG